MAKIKHSVAIMQGEKRGTKKAKGFLADRSKQYQQAQGLNACFKIRLPRPP